MNKASNLHAVIDILLLLSPAPFLSLLIVITWRIFVSCYVHCVSPSMEAIKAVGLNFVSDPLRSSWFCIICHCGVFGKSLQKHVFKRSAVTTESARKTNDGHSTLQWHFPREVSQVSKKPTTTLAPQLPNIPAICVPKPQQPSPSRETWYKWETYLFFLGNFIGKN